MIAFIAKTQGSMLFQVDDKTYSNIGSHDYNLSMFSLPSLGEGAHDVRIYFDETAYVDDVVIYSTSINETSSQKIFSNKKNDRIVLQKISSTEYILYLTKNEINESYLIATISYDDRWKAFVGDVEISPIKMNDILLSFPINVTGDLRIRLVFSGQKYVTLGYSITLITCSVIFITSLVRYIRKKRKENLCE